MNKDNDEATKVSHTQPQHISLELVTEGLAYCVHLNIKEQSRIQRLQSRAREPADNPQTKE